MARATGAQLPHSDGEPQDSKAPKQRGGDRTDALGRRLLHAGYTELIRRLGWAPREGGEPQATTSDAELDAPGGVLASVKLYDVAKVAGMSTGAIYSRWDRSEYLSDLIDYSLSIQRFPESAVIETLEDAIADPTIPLGEVIEKATRQEIEDTEANSGFALQTSLWALAHNNERVQRSFKSMYDEATARWMPLYLQLLTRRRVFLREGFNEKSLTIAITAMLEGLIMRQLVDKEAVPPELFGEAVMAMLAGAIDDGDRKRIRDHLDTIIQRGAN